VVVDAGSSPLTIYVGMKVYDCIVIIYFECVGHGLSAALERLPGSSRSFTSL
jgi:hypothetical protein